MNFYLKWVRIAFVYNVVWKFPSEDLSSGTGISAEFSTIQIQIFDLNLVDHLLCCSGLEIVSSHWRSKVVKTEDMLDKVGEVYASIR